MREVLLRVREFLIKFRDSSRHGVDTRLVSGWFPDTSVTISTSIPDSGEFAIPFGPPNEHSSMANVNPCA